MPDYEREEARERLYRTTSPPKTKTLTGLGHMLDTGEMAAASLVKVNTARERPDKPRMRIRVKRFEEPNWVGLGGRGGKPPILPEGSGLTRPESTVASIDGSCMQRDPDDPEVNEEGEPLRDGDHHREPLKRQYNYQSLTARAYFTNDWKPGESYRKYKPAKHPGAWANVEGIATTSRHYENHALNPTNDISSFTAGPMHRETAYVRPIDCKGNLGARPIQMWKEMLRKDFVPPTQPHGSDHDAGGGHDAEIDELRKLLGNS